MNVLDVIVDGDLGKVPLRYYLGKLLYTLWCDGEGFSGKRPFGNSGWDYDIAYALCAGGFVPNAEWRTYSYAEEGSQVGDRENGEWQFSWKDVTLVIEGALNQAFDINIKDTK